MAFRRRHGRLDRASASRSASNLHKRRATPTVRAPRRSVAKARAGRASRFDGARPTRPGRQLVRHLESLQQVRSERALRASAFASLRRIDGAFQSTEPPLGRRAEALRLRETSAGERELLLDELVDLGYGEAAAATVPDQVEKPGERCREDSRLEPPETQCLDAVGVSRSAPLQYRESLGRHVFDLKGSAPP